MRAFFEGHGHGRAVFGCWRVCRRRAHRRRMTSVRLILGLRLAVASLKRQAKRDLLELRPYLFEKREDGAD